MARMADDRARLNFEIKSSFRLENCTMVSIYVNVFCGFLEYFSTVLPTFAPSENTEIDI